MATGSIQLSDNARAVLAKRYLIKDDNGQPTETPETMFRRVADVIAQESFKYGSSQQEINELSDEFYRLMTTGLFEPNSPTLMNAGRPLGQLSACYVLGVQDCLSNDKDGIYDSLKSMALIHQSGGGTGFAFSKLRPRGSVVRSTTGVASGPVSFMKMYDTSTEVVKQGGTRRGANMGILRVDHPDIREFISCKRDVTQYTNFNISVAVTDAFMEAYKEGKRYALVDPHTGRVSGTEDARSIMQLIVDHAWATGEPGLFFIDKANAYNPVPHIGSYEATNPCLTGDTRILTVEGPRTFKELAEAGEDVLVYTVDKETNEPFVRWMRKPRLTRRKVEVLEIEFDSGLKVKCTPDHNWITRRGKKIQASELQAGSQVMAFGLRADKDGYLITNRDKWGGTRIGQFHKKAHRMVAECLGYDIEGREVHHKDEDKQNNHPENLSLLENSQHQSLHYEDRVAGGFGRHGWKTPEKEVHQKISHTLREKAMVNHRVVSVRHAGFEDVYNGTVDDTHTYVVVDDSAVGSHVWSGVVSANCGEQPLLSYDVCNLGSINVGAYVRDGELNWTELQRDVDTAVRFLDNVIDANKFPLPEIHDLAHRIRRIGLGVMGFADALVRMGIPYNSDEGIEFAADLMELINEAATSASEQLADERGAFPEWERSIWGPDKTCARDRDGNRIAEERRLRNCNVTTVAPTGTISVIADCSGGIEPLFAVAFMRNQAGMKMPDVNKDFVSTAKAQGWYSGELIQRIAESGHIHFPEVPLEVQRVFVTAHDITPEWHVRMQAAFQRYVHSAISKTCNFPKEATKEDVLKIYEMAYDLDCKGVTVYRDGSRPEQVLSTGATEAKPEVHPEKRPDVIRGETRRINTPLGAAYITINSKEDGKPFELFINLGKNGSAVGSFTEAVGRLTTLALRAGVAAEDVVKHLRGISQEESVGFGPNKVLSVPDAVAQCLEKFSGFSAEDTAVSKKVTLATCPNCKSDLVFMEGCEKCPHCNFSKCG